MVSCETCLRGSNRNINRREEEGTLGHGSKTKTIRPGLIGRTPEGIELIDEGSHGPYCPSIVPPAHLLGLVDKGKRWFSVGTGLRDMN